MGKGKIETEKATVKAMIEIYCKANHKQNKICDECIQLIEYACLRAEKCKYQANKPACKDCKTHCYSPEKRNKIKEVMQFSGPRMFFRHPLLSISHLISKHK